MTETVTRMSVATVMEVLGYESKKCSQRADEDGATREQRLEALRCAIAIQDCAARLCEIHELDYSEMYLYYFS